VLDFHPSPPGWWQREGGKGGRKEREHMMEGRNERKHMTEVKEGVKRGKSDTKEWVRQSE
jgi:hypothetical protein